MGREDEGGREGKVRSGGKVKRERLKYMFRERWR